MAIVSCADRESSPPAGLRTLYTGLQPSSSTCSLSGSSVFSSADQESPASTPGTRSEPDETANHTLADEAGDAAYDSLISQLPPFAQGDYILVTGGLGYIGSHTALELMKEGYNVIIVDNLMNSYASVQGRIQALAAKYCESKGRPTPRLVVHELSYQSPSMRFLLEQYSHYPKQDMADAANPERHTRRSCITGVIHFAAYKSVEESIHDPLGYYDNNVCGLIGFLRLLAEFEIRNFVFSSSATVYGSKANTGKPMQEDDVIHHPIEVASTPKDGEDWSAEVKTIQPTVEGLTCPYARTKYFSEAILADVAKSDPSRWRIVVLRYFNPVGSDPSGLLGENPRTPPKNLFPMLSEVVCGKRPALNVFGTDWPTRDGTAVRDYIHVVDVARGHVASLQAGNTAPSFRTYNLGSGTGSSVLEIVDSIAAATGRPVPVKLEGRRAGDVSVCVASTERAESELRWSPRETLTQSARDWWNALHKMNKVPEMEKPAEIETKA